MRIALSILFFFTAFISQAQIPISQARMQSLGSSVTISGIVTNGAELGPIRYIQDATGGLSAYPGTGSVSFSCQRGDSMTVTGVLKNYNGLLELDPITAYTVHSSGNALPTPVVITAAQIGESYESELVQINGATFSSGGGTFAVGTYNFTDAGGNTGVIYVRSGHPLVGQLIPLGGITLVGILSQFTFTGVGGYQILPRDGNDLIFISSIVFASGVSQSNLSQNGFTLSWMTNVAGTGHVRYGQTPQLEIGTLSGTGTSANHSISLSGLQAGKVYYAQAYAVSGGDTAFGNVFPYATVSNSSGAIKVYFNNTVDQSAMQTTPAIYLQNTFNDTIAAYINRAQTNVDLCIYNTNDQLIVTSVNNAHARGVQVRYIAYEGTANAGLSSLNTAIPVFYRPQAAAGLMHNKFVVIDAESTNGAHVITGSTNFTSNNLFDDPNNMVILQDEALARAFKLEFNEMWGSAGSQPNPGLAKYGNMKVDNTPHKFIIGGKAVELYFSPSDGTNGRIIEAIETTNQSMHFAVLSFTRDDIRDAIIVVNNQFGVFANGMIENINDTGGEYTELLNAGIDVRATNTIPDQLHHKYAIIDPNMPSSDPTVVTGSHNWSASAETSNDENTLVIHDHAVADQFYQEFAKRFFEAMSIEENSLMSNALLYPNPATDVINLRWTATSTYRASFALVDMLGRTVYETELSVQQGINEVKLNVNDLPGSVYMAVLSNGSASVSFRVIIK